MAHEEANNFCQSKGKLFQPVATKVVSAASGVDPFVELQFRALSPDDPDYIKPDLEPLPDLMRHIKTEETEQ